MNRLLSILRVKNQQLVRRFIKSVNQEARYGICRELQCDTYDLYNYPVYFKAIIDRTWAEPVVTVQVRTDLVYYTVSLDEFKSWLAVR